MRASIVTTTELTAEAVATRLGAGDSNLLLLDIRPGDAFEEWHIPGSENVDVYEQLKANPQEAAADFDDLPRDSEIVTVCGVGEVSAIATDILVDLGYEAATLKDGLQGWGRVHRSAEIPIESGTLIQIARPGTGCLSYVVIGEGAAIVIDPSQYLEEYETVLDTYDGELAAVLETHAHADHISGAPGLAETHDVLFYLHPADSGDLTGTKALSDGQQIQVGPIDIEVVHTPGHTAGSVTFVLGDEALVTGDTLFLESVGRPDLEANDDAAIRSRAEKLYASLQRLLDGPGETVVLPVHDPGSPTPPTSDTLTAMRERNDLLGLDRATFVWAITANMPETPPNHDRIKRANVGTIALDGDVARQIELGPDQCPAV